MAAYLILMQEVQDVDGEPPNSTVVLRCAGVAAAMRLFNDPDYPPVKEIRFTITSRGQAVVAPEFTPAG